MTQTITAISGTIRQAADMIAKNSLHTGSFYDADWFDNRGGDQTLLADCPMCTAGALFFVTSGDPERENEQCREVIDYVAAHIYSNVDDDDPIERIADWSDARTTGEVVATLRQIADEAEADEN